MTRWDLLVWARRGALEAILIHTCMECEIGEEAVHDIRRRWGCLLATVVN